MSSILPVKSVMTDKTDVMSGVTDVLCEALYSMVTCEIRTVNAMTEVTP